MDALTTGPVGWCRLQQRAEVVGKFRGGGEVQRWRWSSEVEGELRGGGEFRGGGEGKFSREQRWRGSSEVEGKFRGGGEVQQRTEVEGKFRGGGEVQRWRGSSAPLSFEWTAAI